MTATAESLNELGIELKGTGKLAEAEQAYLRAIRLSPDWSVPWYNLGLIYKIQRRWSDSAHCNGKAVELDPEDRDAWWNLGIAATALGDWVLARRAWRGCGIEMPDGDGELRLNYGLTPIRLNPESSGEVVWCDRIDPARAIIRNVPLPGSGHREGDVVLHDGAPNGFRMLGGAKVPVFDSLQVLVPSARSTFEAFVEAPGEDDREALHELASEARIAVEDWETIAPICRKCSEGVPHEVHERVPAPWKAERRLGVSADSKAQAERLLAHWAAAAPERRVLSLRDASES